VADHPGPARSRLARGRPPWSAATYRWSTVVHGAVTGAGVGLLAACDVVLCAILGTNARFRALWPARASASTVPGHTGRCPRGRLPGHACDTGTGPGTGAARQESNSTGTASARPTWASGTAASGSAAGAAAAAASPRVSSQLVPLPPVAVSGSDAPCRSTGPRVCSVSPLGHSFKAPRLTPRGLSRVSAGGERVTRRRSSLPADCPRRHQTDRPENAATR
jgi:hypothetical protein